MKNLSLKDVLDRVKKVADLRGDSEAAHGAEDDLHQEVLRAIADGICDDPAACARGALATLEIKFSRWCA